MKSALLDLQDALGDAIIVRFATDSIVAPVVTNPAQGIATPYAVIGQDSETGEGATKTQEASSVAHNIFLHSSTMVEAKQMANSVLQAIGPGETRLSLGANFYEVRRELEANDISIERRPEGDIYNTLIRMRFQIGHR